MKVQSKAICNLGFSTASGRILIPAGATLELSDSEWKALGDQPAGHIENGTLVIVEEVAKSEEEIKAEETNALEAAKKLIENSKKTEKKTDDK